MARLYLFADEAGDFAFNRNHNASRYFIVCTVTTRSCAPGPDLIELRRDLAWKKKPVGDHFHASTDSQAVRDEVFKVICRHDFQVQATIMEKSKAQPQVRSSRGRFYQYGWLYHFRHGIARYIPSATELLVTVASVGTKKGQIEFTDAVRDVLNQNLDRNQWSTAFWAAKTDPCLQLADYCTWAIQRKWEKADERSYKYIADRITYEYDLWARGNSHYY